MPEEITVDMKKPICPVLTRSLVSRRSSLGFFRVDTNSASQADWWRNMTGDERLQEKVEKHFVSWIFNYIWVWFAQCNRRKGTDLLWWGISVGQTGSQRRPGRLDKKPTAFLNCGRRQILCHRRKKLELTTELVSGIRKPSDSETWELEVLGPVPAALY